MKNKKIIMIILITIVVMVIIAGIVMIKIKGFNKNATYNNVSMISIMKPYFIPAIIVTLLSTLYYSIMYRKKGVLKICTTTILSVILILAFVISIYAISRLEINTLFMSVLLLAFIAVFFTLSKIYSK